MKKTLIFLSSHPLGTEVMAAIRLRRLLPRVEKRGWQVICLTPAGPRAQGLDVEQPDFPKFLCRGPRVFRRLAYVFWAAAKTLATLRQSPQLRVVASIPDIETLIAGALIKILAGQSITLILEVRDPFSLNSALPWSSTKRALARAIEGFMVRWPDRALFLTTEIQSLYKRGFPRSGAWQTNSRVITNGFDPSEFPAPKDGETGPRLVITHSGHFYDRRSPVLFLKALSEVMQESTSRASPAIRFIGRLHGDRLKSEVAETMRRPFLDGVVEWYDELPHAQALAMIQRSDVNLLITHDQGSEYAIPGKLFEYMGSGRPVLAISHDPLVKHLVSETSLGWLCESEEALKDWLRRYLSRLEDVRNFQTDRTAIARYQIEPVVDDWISFVGEATP